MNEEKGLLTTTYLGRVLEKGLAFTVSKLQKNESLPHSFFFARKGSKVIFRVTQKSPEGSFAFLRKPCSARLPTLPPAPDGCMLKGRLQACTSSPDGHFRFGLFEFVASLGFHNPKV